MEEDDGLDTRKYIDLKNKALQNILEPNEYKRICYFANWAGLDLKF
jgi:hypothetical protein